MKTRSDRAQDALAPTTDRGGGRFVRQVRGQLLRDPQSGALPLVTPVGVEPTSPDRVGGSTATTFRRTASLSYGLIDGHVSVSPATRAIASRSMCQYWGRINCVANLDGFEPPSPLREACPLPLRYRLHTAINRMWLPLANQNIGQPR